MKYLIVLFILISITYQKNILDGNQCIYQCCEDQDCSEIGSTCYQQRLEFTKNISDGLWPICTKFYTEGNRLEYQDEQKLSLFQSCISEIFNSDSKLDPTFMILLGCTQKCTQNQQNFDLYNIIDYISGDQHTTQCDGNQECMQRSVCKLTGELDYSCTMDSNKLSQAPVISNNSPILSIECESAFNELNVKEKLYSYYFTRASWEGAKICFFQRSYESPALFYLLFKVFSKESPALIRQKLLTLDFSEDEISHIMVYTAAFFQNCGNYKSFGDTKFVPEVSQEKFEKFLKSSEAFKAETEKFSNIWEQIKLELFSYHSPYYLIEMSDNQGSTSYYSSNITKKEAESITKFMETKEDLSPLNTRVIKVSDNVYDILVCSAQKLPTQTYKTEDFEVRVNYGDFAPFMKNLYQYLAQALPYAANQNQTDMLVKYLEHFTSGSINKHKDASISWIKDKGPVVETYIGFIESYLDPLKVRAEYEGFVSIVNKQESLKLNTLVEKAEDLIQNLPWPSDFEVEVFTKPDFTSLEVLAFACSGTPVGINIPNYDDVRQNIGFKNVNLGNVYGTPKKENVLFTKPETVDKFVEFYKPSLFVIVALHELLGHGTGKLFSRDEEGKYNFDYEMVHPITGAEIQTFYDVNETWHSKFGEVSSGYEECRADGVALYLSCFQQSLDILIPEYTKEQQQDIVYVAWYEIIYSAIKGLEYYDVVQKKWGQAHIRAAYALFQVMLQAGEGFVSIESQEKDGKPYLYINLDKEKIATVGKKAVGDFLLKLQVYKSTADVETGTKFFEEYCKVDDEMIKFRDIAIANKLPRKIELQHDVELIGADEDSKYVKFDQTFEGIISSHIFHYGFTDIETVYTQWEKYASDFRIKQN